MDEPQEKWLTEKYPVLYGRGVPYREGYQFCFECGNGWFSIMNAIGMALANRDTPVASQVKEKFGTLRFYTNGDDDFSNGVIDMAERLSARTCEMSGRYGFLTNNSGWIRVLSPDNMAESSTMAGLKPEAHHDGMSKNLVIPVVTVTLAEKELSFPQGIAKLVNDALNSFKGAGWLPARQSDIVIQDITFDTVNGLVFNVEKANDHEQGAIKMAVVLATLMNPETGDLPIEPKNKE
jgi:hypothetical protein